MSENAMEAATGITWRDNPRAAFDEAIADGRLSATPGAPNYVGHFMYMGTKGGRDMFKDSMTRKYLP